MSDFFNQNLINGATLWHPQTTGTDMLKWGQAQATPPFVGNQGIRSQQEKSQQQGDQQRTQQQNYWENTIVPGYYMGQMASAMGGGPAGGALAGAASSGLNMLFNYFQGKYGQQQGAVGPAYTPTAADTPTAAQWAAYDAGSTPAGTRDV